MKTETLRRRKRPFGVRALIVLLALYTLNGALDLLRVLNGLPPHTLPNLPTPTLLFLEGVITIGCVILAVGLWQMRVWAWYATMIACGASMSYAIWRHLDGGVPYFSMLLLVIMVFYLNQREVKAVFAPVRGAEVTA